MHKPISKLKLIMSLALIIAVLPLTAENSAKEKFTHNKTDLDDQVVIQRTEYGVPHISADNFEAAGYGLGYVQMEDYGEKVINHLIKSRGEWTKYHAVDEKKLRNSLDEDIAHKIKYEKAVKTWAKLDEDTQDIIKGFAKGVNLYIKQNPEKFDDWVEPFFTVYDVHSAGIEDIPLSTSYKFLKALRKKQSRKKDGNKNVAQIDFKKKTNSSEQNQDDSILWTRLAYNYKKPHTDAGSNAWAFSPSRTESGNTILVRNPHLSWDAGYYEVHLNIKDKFNFYGDFRIGGPLITIGGFNKNLGWSTTDNSSFMDEIYAFETDSVKPDHFLLDGASVPIQRKTISVQFKNGKGTGEDNREVLTTPYGPVIYRGNGKIYVLKSSAEKAFRGSEQYLKMMQADNLEDWKEAMRIRGIITSNFTYADGDGNIFYVWNGAVPDLPVKWSGDTTATAVSKSSEIWHNLVSWDDLPQLENPKGGYVHNENDSFHFTNLNELLDDYPDYFSKRAFDLRSQKSYELIHNADQKFSLEDVVKMKSNSEMLLADRVKSDLVRAVKDSKPSQEIGKAIELIAKWDNTVDRESRGGLLFKTWWYRYVKTADSTHVVSSPESVGFSATPEKLFKEVWSPENPVKTPKGLADLDRATKAFKWAVNETKKKYGSWDEKWGDIHRAIAGKKDVGVSGCSGQLGCFRVLWYTGTKKDGKNIQKVRGGDGWVLAVEFDEVPRAYSILAYGESDSKDSPYYYNQLEMFANEKMKTVNYTPKDIRKNTKRKYSPGDNK